MGLNDNPIVIYSDSKAVSVTEINFPAVSICPPLKVGVDGFDGFNYWTISDEILNGTRNFTELEYELLISCSFSQNRVLNQIEISSNNISADE